MFLSCSLCHDEITFRFHKKNNIFLLGNHRVKGVDEFSSHFQNCVFKNSIFGSFLAQSDLEKSHMDSRKKTLKCSFFRGTLKLKESNEFSSTFQICVFERKNLCYFLAQPDMMKSHSNSRKRTLKMLFL